MATKGNKVEAAKGDDSKAVVIEELNEALGTNAELQKNFAESSSCWQYCHMIEGNIKAVLELLA